MTDPLNAPRRRQKKASPPSDRDPVLWLILIVSFGVIGAFGVGKFLQYRHAQEFLQADGSGRPAGSSAAPSSAMQHELSPELRGTDRPGGMEAGSFTTIDAASDVSIHTVAPATSTTTAAGRSKTLTQDCNELKQEQQTIEAKLRRPIGAHTAEQLRAQLGEISATMQRAGCA